MALVNMQRWLAEHGAAGTAQGEGNGPNDPDPSPEEYIHQLEATVAYQTELITALQATLRAKVIEEENHTRAVREILRQPAPRSRVIRKPRGVLPERK
jgi:hypothetical protein